MSQSYRIFKRKAWIRKTWAHGWEPYIGRKTTVGYTDDIEDARRVCKAHNDQRKSRGDTFCEFES